MDITSSQQRGEVVFWKLDGTRARTFVTDAIAEVSCVAVLSDGLLAVGLSYSFYDEDDEDAVIGPEDEGGEIRVYDIQGTLVHAFARHVGSVWHITATRDGEHIISSSFKTVLVWSIARKSLLCTCNEHIWGVTALAAMPDGRRFLSGGLDSAICVWSIDGTLENSCDNAAPNQRLDLGGVRAIVTLPDNQHALFGSNDYTVKLFNVYTFSVLRTFTHHTMQVSSLALLPDGRSFVSGSNDGTVCVVEHGLAPLPCEWIQAPSQ